MYSPRRFVPEGRASRDTPHNSYFFQPSFTFMPKRNKKNQARRRRRTGGGRGDPSSVPGPRGRDLVSGVVNARGMGLLTGMPDRLEVDLAYQVNARVNPGVVAYADTVFDLNNLFDPERTGTGHQPREYDQLAALYLYYRVYQCKVEVELRQRASHGIRLVLIASNSGTALTISDNPAEQRRAWVSAVTGSNQPAIKVVRVYDIASILGMTRAQHLASEDTDAAVTTGPDLIALLHMFVEQIDGTTACDFEYSLKMVFRTVFHEKKVLGLSLDARSAASAASASSAATSAAALVVRRR